MGGGALLRPFIEKSDTFPSHLPASILFMSRQTRDEVNAAQRRRYAQRTQRATKARHGRQLGVVSDRHLRHLTLRQIAQKRGLSVSGVRRILTMDSTV